MASRSREVTPRFNLLLGRPQLPNVSGSGTHFTREMVLQKVTKVARNTEHISCEVKFRELAYSVL